MAEKPVDDMDLEAPVDDAAGAKRHREEEEVEDKDCEKRARFLGTEQEQGEKSVEEKRIEKESSAGEKEEDEKSSKVVKLGPKEFVSSVEMFNYFFKLLHSWSTNLDINKYEHMVLLDLLKKGHPDPEKKIREGISTFQVRIHPLWKSRCFFVVRVDGSSDDFSFRKCVDQILPLPENMKTPSISNGRSKSCRGGRGGHGRQGRGRKVD